MQWALEDETEKVKETLKKVMEIPKKRIPVLAVLFLMINKVNSKTLDLESDSRMHQLAMQQELYRDKSVDVRNSTRVIGEVLMREKRWLAFPFLSTAGIICAVAIPLPNPSVFFSYNFEANYNLPYQGSDFTTGIANRLDLINPARSLKDTAVPQINSTSTTENSSKTKRSAQKSLITRKRFYKTFEERLNAMGLDGRKCLLRSICEASELPVHEHNGLVGDIFHIFFTPSTSRDENLPPEFYKAEQLGAQGDCSKYIKYCKESVLDLMSRVIQH